MSKKKSYNGPSKKGGIWTYEIETWKEFCNLLFNKFEILPQKEDNRNSKDFVWRGHRCANWHLISAFDRVFGTESIIQRKAKLKTHLDSYAYAVRGRLTEVGLTVSDIKTSIKQGALNKNHLWAIAQHYKLPTPLLDWTTSPFCAAYFAFEEAIYLDDLQWKKLTDKKAKTIRESKTEKVAEKIKKSLPAQDRVVIGLKYKTLCRATKRVEYFSPMSSEFTRLINQRGLFTIAAYGEDIEEIIKEVFPDKEDGPWLVKIKLPQELREVFLRQLNLMNINHMSLFPNLEGSSRFCEIGLELEDYALFPGQDPEL
ncbi:MAG: FRG domain-containing protein [Phycisphaerales bacterium]|jgi:hypothetical protein